MTRECDVCGDGFPPSDLVEVGDGCVCSECHDTLFADGTTDTTETESTVGRSPALEAFADAVEFFHEQLDRPIDDHQSGKHTDRPNTGRGYIKKWGAYAGEVVKRDDGKGTNRSYGGFGDRVLTHMREHDTLQAAMRFGHDGNGTVVYVHTDTLPGWVSLAGEGRVLTTWSTGMHEVIDAAADLGEWRTGEIVDSVSITERQVRERLHTLQKRGYLDARHEGRGFT